MKRVYRILWVCIVATIALLGLASTAFAQDPEGLTVGDLVPPRPDLMGKLGTSSTERGFSLDMAEAEKASAAYHDYLAAKMDPKSWRPLTVKSDKEGSSLQAAPANDKVIVALVDFNDLAHDNISKPSTENNTDYWVENFDEAHYETLLFSETNQWSLRNYFREASDYGGSPTGYDLIGDVHDWDAVPGNAAQYGDDDPAGGVDNEASDGYDLEQLVKDAADDLSGWTPSGGWASYCSDGSTVDYFIVVHAGKGQEVGGGALGDDAIWSMHGSLGSPYPVTGSYDVKNFIVLSEDTPVGVFVHELGHLFGLPDTWNPYSGTDAYDEMAWPQQTLSGDGEASPSFYDPMAQGCWLGRPLGTRPASMTAWERIQTGWLTPAVWDLNMMPASIYLAQLETPSASNKALKIELPARTYVSPHSGSYMRQAPDPDHWSSPNELYHTFDITASSSVVFRFWDWYDLEDGQDCDNLEV